MTAFNEVDYLYAMIDMNQFLPIQSMLDWLQENYSVDGFVKKGQWNQSKAEVLETIVREANEIPAPEDIISDGMAEVDRVIDELLDLEQSVMSSIEMYQEETGDLRFEQILNQGARYIQSAQRNLQYLHKMLKRNL